MHFLIREALSFNLMYVAACYPVGTTILKTSSLFTALLQHYNIEIQLSEYRHLVKRVGDEDIVTPELRARAHAHTHTHTHTHRGRIYGLRQTVIILAPLDQYTYGI